MSAKVVDNGTTAIGGAVRICQSHRSHGVWKKFRMYFFMINEKFPNLRRMAYATSHRDYHLNKMKWGRLDIKFILERVSYYMMEIYVMPSVY